MTPPNRPRFGEVARAFLGAGRDTLELCIVPHLIGQGIPLFSGDTRPSNLRLTRSRQCPNGLVCLDYDVLG
jgi:dihydrofolate reductase